MTLPRAESERLIFVASLKRSPVAPVLLCRSLPVCRGYMCPIVRRWDA